MSIKRFLAGAALSAGTAAAVAAPVALTGTSPAGAVVTTPALPQAASAATAASWLADQVTASGAVDYSGAPYLSYTADTALALAQAGGHGGKLSLTLNYLRKNVWAYASSTGKQGGALLAGHVALLLLDARAAGGTGTDFGGTNLVKDLESTMRTSGTNAGLFGSQDPSTYDDGAYDQGLALAALAQAGVTGSAVAPALTWLKDQQCSDGGWQNYTTPGTACPAVNDATYTGPDTNDTALAIDGIKAQGASAKISPDAYLESQQNADGGWGDYSTSSDPDSTSLVLQAVYAKGERVSTTPYVKNGKDGVYSLLGFQLKSGAFTYPDSGNAANTGATYQAIPTLLKKGL